MSNQKRKEIILALLDKNGKVNVNELARDMDVSEKTIRRDLDKMEKEGLLVRSHGGAIRPDMTEFSVEERGGELPEEEIKISKPEWLVKALENTKPEDLTKPSSHNNEKKVSSPVKNIKELMSDAERSKPSSGDIKISHSGNIIEPVKSLRDLNLKDLEKSIPPETLAELMKLVDSDILNNRDVAIKQKKPVEDEELLDKELEVDEGSEEELEYEEESEEELEYEEESDEELEVDEESDEELEVDEELDEELDYDEESDEELDYDEESDEELEVDEESDEELEYEKPKYRRPSNKKLEYEKAKYRKLSNKKLEYEKPKYRKPSNKKLEYEKLEYRKKSDKELEYHEPKYQKLEYKKLKGVDVNGEELENKPFEGRKYEREDQLHILGTPRQSTDFYKEKAFDFYEEQRMLEESTRLYKQERKNRQKKLASGKKERKPIERKDKKASSKGRAKSQDGKGTKKTPTLRKVLDWLHIIVALIIFIGGIILAFHIIQSNRAQHLMLDEGNIQYESMVYDDINLPLLMDEDQTPGA